MANSKSGSTTKKTSVKKTTTKKPTTATNATTVRTVSASPEKRRLLDGANVPAIIIAEIVGTFVLTLIALLTIQSVAPLYVGITFAVLVLAIGAVSGAHVNPAVTFGLWSVRRLKSVLLPVYWVAQFVGVIAAMLLLGALSGNGINIDLGHFGTLNWGILAVELVATAVFIFGVVAVTSQKTLSAAGQAFGVGLSLTIGILISMSLFTTLQSGVDTANVSVADPTTIPHEYSVKGATLNPAIALAATENTTSQLSGGAATPEETQYSRLGLETILGTLIGAALGANLYLLLGYARKNAR